MPAQNIGLSRCASLFPVSERFHERRTDSVRNSSFPAYDLGLHQPATAAAQMVGEAKAGENDAFWIWSPPHAKDLVPAGECYFRGAVELEGDELATIQVTADDRYELFINGRRVGKGETWKLFKTYDVKDFIRRGTNVIAVKAVNATGPSAGMAARFSVAVEGGGTLQLLGSDTSWKTSLKEFDGWEAADFDDSQWVPAQLRPVRANGTLGQPGGQRGPARRQVPAGRRIPRRAGDCPGRRRFADCHDLQ